MRKREPNDLHKVVQEVHYRAGLCLGALLQDMLKTQIHKWDILVCKAIRVGSG